MYNLNLRRSKREEAEKAFKEIVIVKSKNLIKKFNLKIQEAQQIQVIQEKRELHLDIVERQRQKLESNKRKQCITNTRTTI